MLDSSVSQQIYSLTAFLKNAKKYVYLRERVA